MKAFRMFLPVVVGASVVLVGCATSQNQQSGNLDYETNVDGTEYLFGSDTAQEIIDAVLMEQSRRTRDAWENGPSGYQASLAKMAGKDPREGWQPEIRHPAEELAILEHYKDGVQISELLVSTPAIVRMNDKQILVSFPNSWLWHTSFDTPTELAQAYTEKLGNMLRGSRVNMSVSSYPSNQSVSVNRQNLAQARADSLARVMENYSNRPAGTILAIGFGSTYSTDSSLSQSTVIDVRHEFDVDSSDYRPQKSIYQYQ